MDQIQKNQGFMCLAHPSNEVIYLQVNEISQDQIIFYCETCISKDYDFKPQNCIRIKQLLESQQDQIIFSWPPLNDRNLQKKVNDYSFNEGEAAHQMQMKIITEFDELRQKILQKLKDLEKQALLQVEKIYSFENQFIKKYREISQVEYLKKIIEDYINKKGEMHTSLSVNKQMQDQQGIFIIGLVRDEYKNTQQFTNDNLCCGILFSNNQIYLDSYTNGICQIVKGDFDYLSNETEFQLVVHQSQNILYITDLPQNKHKAILMDQYQINLQTYQNLRLCIKLYDNISISLTSAIIE